MRQPAASRSRAVCVFLSSHGPKCYLGARAGATAREIWPGWPAAASGRILGTFQKAGRCCAHSWHPHDIYESTASGGPGILNWGITGGGLITCSTCCWRHPPEPEKPDDFSTATNPQPTDPPRRFAGAATRAPMKRAASGAASRGSWGVFVYCVL